MAGWGLHMELVPDVGLYVPEDSCALHHWGLWGLVTELNWRKARLSERVLDWIHHCLGVQNHPENKSAPCERVDLLWILPLLYNALLLLLIWHMILIFERTLDHHICYYVVFFFFFLNLCFISCECIALIGKYNWRELSKSHSNCCTIVSNGDSLLNWW